MLTILETAEKEEEPLLFLTFSFPTILKTESHFKKISQL